MIYHSLSDFLIAIFYFFTYGIIVAGVYVSENIIILWIKKFIRIPTQILKRKETNNKLNEKKNFIAKNEVFNFFFFLIFGIGYIILQYIALDGAFRLFFLIIFLLGFFISKKSAGELIKNILNFLFEFLYKIFFFISKILLFPLYMLIRFLIRLFTPFLAICKRGYQSFRKKVTFWGNIKKLIKF